MDLKADDYVVTPRDTARERSLAKDLRTRPEADRLSFIRYLITKGATSGDTDALKVGLWLANSCLQKRQFLVELFEEGLTMANESTIQLWLRYFVPKLGFQRVVEILHDTYPVNSKAVGDALYWLHSFLPPDDRRAIEAYWELWRSAGGLLRTMPQIPKLAGKGRDHDADE